MRDRMRVSMDSALVPSEGGKVICFLDKTAKLGAEYHKAHKALSFQAVHVFVEGGHKLDHLAQFGDPCFRIVVVICNYLKQPDNGGYNAEHRQNAFTARVDPVSAPSYEIWNYPYFIWWSRRVLPPGPQRLFRTNV